ncbi:GL25699 [Drosophila persimilis]|uniref:GL25699 n=1 Tax=Drosophila persimilis TaxID=7234 RepID=B4GKD4_DROPE|nr:60 kDa heat shock protein homolog 2, mitochondrial [Drosophila persimilis]EDW37100.1 GL25699 [Drosophila persimilis]
MLKRCGRDGRRYVIGAIRTYAKDIRFGPEARGLLLKGVDIMTNAVSATLGPRGRNVLIEQLMISPRITKDGITVANNVQLDDRRCNMGAQLLRETTRNTNNEVGDGTTTATILARGMASQGLEVIRQGQVNVHALREGMLEGSRVVCDALQSMSQRVETIDEVVAVARVALNGDKRLSEMIGRAIQELGEGGVFLLKESKSLSDELKVQQGITLPEGFVSPLFACQGSGNRVEYSNVLLLATLAHVERLEDILPALELAKSREQPLLIIATDISEEVVKALVINKLRNGLRVCAVKAPSFGSEQRDQMQDLALAMGANLLENTTRLAAVQGEDLGVVSEVIVDSSSTHLLHPRIHNADQVQARVQHIRALLEEAITDEEVEKLNERMGRLLGHLATIYVGGANDLEVSEKKDRLNDALHAMHGAISDGIVPGGGTAYLRCIPALESLPRSEIPDHQIGRDIVGNSLRLPCYTIARNAGVNPAEVIRQVLEGSGNFGYDAAAGEYCDLKQRGIVDPASALRSAMSEAAGIASLLATTEVLITEERIRPKVPRNQVTKDLASLIGM